MIGAMHPLLANARRWTHRVISAGVVLIAVGALVFPQAQSNAHRPGFVALFAGLAGAVLICGARLPVPATIGIAFTRARSLPVLIATLSAFTAFFIGRALAYPFGWDARVLWDAAEVLAEGSRLEDYPYDYLSRYPNNIPMLALNVLLIKGTKLFGLDQDLSIAAANGVALFVMSMSIYVVVRAATTKIMGVFAQLLVFLFMALSPWSAVPYTDIPVAALLIAALALGIVAARNQKLFVRYALLAAAGCLIAAAGTLKPSAYLVLIAVIGAGFLGENFGFHRDAPSEGSSERRLVNMLKMSTISVVAASLIMSPILELSSEKLSGLEASRLDDERAFPALHWVRLGLLEKQSSDGAYTSYGGYNREAVTEAGAAPSNSERSLLTREAIRDRLSELGPAGVLTFATKKTIWTWGDATFSSWSEGIDDSEPLKRDGPLSQAVQKFAHPSGNLFQVWGELLTGLWISLLTLGALGVARRPEQVPMLLSIVVLGVVAYTLLFEGRSRYLIAELPLLLAYVSIGFFALRQQLRGIPR